MNENEYKELAIKEYVRQKLNYPNSYNMASLPEEINQLSNSTERFWFNPKHLTSAKLYLEILLNVDVSNMDLNTFYYGCIYKSPVGNQYTSSPYTVTSSSYTTHIAVKDEVILFLRNQYLNEDKTEKSLSLNEPTINKFKRLKLLYVNKDFLLDEKEYHQLQFNKTLDEEIK